MTNSNEYIALARKYRPGSFAEVIGQEPLVQTLSNAFKSERIHHAYIFTGIRGTGKTSTARILAKSLNCENGPTLTPCGTCTHCTSIAHDNHVDIIEMDAASRTGVDDVREIIESVPYAPSMARFKVYIIDEVHMLSKQAFNALLKTLEEPPKHVKFIFATTEIRKVPVTILSRCQRFDLRRIEAETLAAHYAKIAQAEGANPDPEAINIIAYAADGSVRDGLSILDQAISNSGGTLSADNVRHMLGLAEKTKSLEIIEAAMEGDLKKAYAALTSTYQDGVDPLNILQDMLEYSHFVSVASAVPQASQDPSMSQAFREIGTERAQKIGLGKSHTVWKKLLEFIPLMDGNKNAQQILLQAIFQVHEICNSGRN